MLAVTEAPRSTSREAHVRIFPALPALLVLSTCLLPNIPFGNNFVLRLEDAFVVAIVTMLVYQPSAQLADDRRSRTYVWLLSLFFTWILITIVANGRSGSPSDYFELYKLVKFALVMLLIFHFIRRDEWRNAWIPPLLVIGLSVGIFNLVSLFDFASFNLDVLPVYAEEHHLIGFHEGSRLVGTMGNPNNNAILLAFFASFSLALLVTGNFRVWSGLLFVASLVLMLLAQSRSTFMGMLAGVLLFYLTTTTRANALRALALLGTTAALGYVALTQLSLEYLSSLWETDIEENTSLLARFSTWSFLYEMIQQAPIFGHGPNKAFFYANNLFADNEYILMAWRYGYPGVVLYLAVILVPASWAVRHVKAKRNVWCKTMVLMTGVIGVAALANNPLSEPRILVLYAVLCGSVLAEAARSEKASKGSNEGLARYVPATT